MEKQEQENMYKLSIFEQQINQLEQQLQAVNQRIVELSNLNLGLDDLKNSKDKKIMAGIGKGMFIKAKILDDNLLVDIGGKNLVKKTIPQAQKLISKQVEKLSEIKKQIEDSIEELAKKISEVIEKSQEEKRKK